MTDQTPQGRLYGPQSAPDDSRGAGAAHDASERRTAARDGLRKPMAEALTAAAYECDGNCGLSERECYDAHPVNFSAMSMGTTHVTGAVTAIADICAAVRDRELERLRARVAELEQQAVEDDGEPVCMDECGWCDACGMEPFGSPAEGWREAARFLRRTPRDSADYPGALRGARLIEDELRRVADGQQQEDATSWTPGPVALARAAEQAQQQDNRTTR